MSGYTQSEFSKARVKEIQDQLRQGKRPFADTSSVGAARTELERLADTGRITAGEVRAELATITGPSRLDVLAGQLAAEGMTPALVRVHQELAILEVERQIVLNNPGLGLEGEPARLRAAALAILSRPPGTP